MTHQRDDSGSGFTKFLFGAVVGAGVALLFAPRTGKETRRRLSEFDPDAITGRVNEAVNGVSDVIDRGVNAYKKASSGTEA